MATDSRAIFVQSDLSGAFDDQQFTDLLHALHQTDFEPLRARAQATPAMTVAVQASTIQTFYKAPFLNSVALNYAGGNSPTFTAPTTNPRIDLVVLNASNVLEIVQGTEAASPNPPTYPTDKFPICEVYLRVGMANIQNIENSGANPTQGYIYKDCRPKMAWGSVTDHGGLTGLSDDDHVIYAKLAGRAGGQTLQGGTAASENLNLESTAHATKGRVVIKGGRAKFEDAGVDPAADGELYRNAGNLKMHDGTAVRTFVHSNTTAGGDLSGTYPNPTVAKIQGRSMAATAPNASEAIAWDGSTWKPMRMGWVFVETLTLSGSSHNTATLPTDADMFMLVFQEALGNTAGLDLSFNVAPGGTEYEYVTLGGTTLAAATGQGKLPLVQTGGVPINGTVIFQRAGSNDKMAVANLVSDANGRVLLLRGTFNNTSAITSIYITCATTSSGKVHLFKLGKQ